LPSPPIPLAYPTRTSELPYLPSLAWTHAARPGLFHPELNSSGPCPPLSPSLSPPSCSFVLIYSCASHRLIFFEVSPFTFFFDQEEHVWNIFFPFSSLPDLACWLTMIGRQDSLTALLFVTYSGCKRIVEFCYPLFPRILMESRCFSV